MKLNDSHSRIGLNQKYEASPIIKGSLLQQPANTESDKMFQDLQDRLHRFAEKKITRLDDLGQIITDENGASGDPDDSNAEKAHVRLVKGGSVEA